jgi:phenylpropionate dioxygenase-like ring-hydroxylating dioxygenase large terminal subunit
MFLRNLWYFATYSSAVPGGKLVSKVFLSEPIVLGRSPSGEAFALRDLCPHRGVPLSKGQMLEGAVECPYHGWRFRPNGQCAHIPSLVEGQDLDPTKISVRSYPVAERNGLIWIFMGEDGNAKAHEPPPALPVSSEARPRMREMQLFPCELDSAVVGLMDPAHGPFVHKSWWWRSRKSIHAKAKNYAPSELGFTMTAHKPSRNSTLYHLLGGELTTEIAFKLPGVRIEDIRAGKNQVLSLTTCTPVDETKTEVTQTFFWTVPWLVLVKPFFRAVASEFLAQDRRMVTMQQEAARFNPRQMLIQDADTPAIWYLRIKKEWAAALAERRPFVNPVTPVTLHWRS